LCSVRVLMRSPVCFHAMHLSATLCRAPARSAHTPLRRATPHHTPRRAGVRAAAPAGQALAGCCAQRSHTQPHVPQRARRCAPYCVCVCVWLCVHAVPLLMLRARRLCRLLRAHARRC
jgi:hypothetical protein